jgi:pre-mRNA cleavage complex 2 protein Pcf11
MDAYLVMDQNTRKNMEGLLRTWKMPVPESMDPRPVFQADVTQDIENALAKFRAAQQQIRPQHALPPRPPSLNVAWRGTSTPPQTGPRYAAPNDPRARPVSFYYNHQTTLLTTHLGTTFDASVWATIKRAYTAHIPAASTAGPTYVIS